MDRYRGLLYLLAVALLLLAIPVHVHIIAKQLFDIDRHRLFVVFQTTPAQIS